MKPKCYHCKKEVSNKDDLCPHCGTNLKSRRKALGIGCGLFVFIIVAMASLAFLSDDDTTPELTAEQKRTQKIEKCFSAWDGSQINLTNRIKSSLNDEDSYKHIETTYIDKDSVLYVQTIFSAKNGFGGTIKQTVIVETNLNCEITDVVQWIQ